MFLKIFLVSTLLFVCCDGKPLKPLEFSAEVKESLIPDRDAFLKAYSELSIHQQFDYAMFELHNLDKLVSSSYAEQEEAVNKLKESDPQIYQKFNDAEKAFNQTLSEMSQPTQKFFDYFNDHRRGFTAELTSDEEFSKFLCSVSSRWNGLNVEQQNEINAKFPKLHKTLCDKQLQQKACNFSTDSTVEKEIPAEFA